MTKIDNTDLEILNILQKKARIPNVEVARSVEMAPSAVLERIKKLEARNIIQGYEVRLNPEMFDCSMIAFILIKVAKPGDLDRTGKAISRIEQVQEVHHIAGEDSLMIKLRTKDTTSLDTLLKEKIAAVKEVCHTRTLIALSSYKESAKITLPVEPE